MVVDTHCHLSHCEGSAEEVLDRATEAGVAWVVDVGMGLAESRASVGRSSGDSRIRVAVGIHPNDLSDYRADHTKSIDALREIAQAPQVVAIGETGLDWYWDKEDRSTQRDCFAAQIDLAIELDKALVIHCRDAFSDLMNFLEKRPSPKRVVMHCFSSDAAGASECVSRGYFCGFGGSVTYPKNVDVQEAAKAVPDELILIETDSPYLSPVPFRGKRNEPARVVHTLQKLADLRGQTVESLAAITSANAERAFALPTSGGEVRS